MLSYHEFLEKVNFAAPKLFDPIRRKWVASTPEEHVRQYTLFVLLEKDYPSRHLSVERTLWHKKKRLRFDICILNAQAEPQLVIECKRASQGFSETDFHQLAGYNALLRAPWLSITNGITTLSLSMSKNGSKLRKLSEIPPYALLVQEA